MPGTKSGYAKKQADWCAKNGYTKTSSQKVVVSKNKLMDKKINTLFEKRAQEIVKNELVKNRVNLIRRIFHYGTYNESFNHFEPGIALDWRGSIKSLHFIPKTDLNQPVNQLGGVQDPEDTDDDNPVDVDGPVQGITTESLMGKRSEDFVKISGITIGLRILLKNIDSQHNLLGSVRIRWAVVAFRDEGLINSPLVEPDIDQLLNMQEFGYSKKIDINDENSDNLGYIKKVLLSGKIDMKYDMTANREEFIHRHVKLNNPLELRWDPRDQTGQEPLKWRLFFILRSTVPNNPPGFNFDVYKPDVKAFSMVHYYQ